MTCNLCTTTVPRMITLQIILVSLVASGSSFNLSYVLPNTDQWNVPNFINGNLTLITRALVEAELGAMAEIPDLVDYYLFTQSNPNKSQQLKENDSSTLQQSNFNPAKPTRIIIHGFQSSSDEPVCTSLRDAYLKKGPHNIICVDWGQIASKHYPTARFVVPSVGEDLAVFIDYLCKAGRMKIENLIVIGHSLGAHASGFAGKALKSKHGRKIPLIIGCDPASPLFDYNDCSSRLCETDAGFVESIQTCGGRLGFLKPIGAGSYYPNGGVTQPGCETITELVGVCSHSRSYMYLAEAIEINDFPTMKCKDYKSAVVKKCGSTFSSMKMGSQSKIQTKGIFYVPVNKKPPYGKGK